MEPANPCHIQRPLRKSGKPGPYLLLCRRGRSRGLGRNLRRHWTRRLGHRGAVRLRLPASAGGVGQRRRVSRCYNGWQWNDVGRPARHIHVGPRRVASHRAQCMLSDKTRRANVSGSLLPLLLRGQLVRGRPRSTTHLRQAHRLAAAVAAAAAPRPVWLPGVGRRGLQQADRLDHHSPRGWYSARDVPTAQAKPEHRAHHAGHHQSQVLWRKLTPH